MDALELTMRLGAALEVECEHTVRALFGFVQPTMTEWSFNRPQDPRGAFRVALWNPAAPPVSEDVRRLGLGFAEPLWTRTAEQASHHGIGAAFRLRGDPTLRFWALARSGGGQQLAEAAVAAEPDLEPAYQLLADAAGGARQFRAVSVEGRLDQVQRRTLYASLSTPTAVLRLLELIGCPATQRGNLFFKALLGLEEGPPRAWPVLWVGRSVGENAGWKFYYFARSDPQRREDAVLLDLVDAAPALHDAWTMIRGLNPGPKGVVQFLGLTMSDAQRDAEPSWTVYLSPL